MLDRMGTWWKRITAGLGALLMGAGLIGLPSLPDDLARWPPILAQAAAGLDFMTQTQLGRWVLFIVGVAVFYFAVTARNRPVKPPILLPAVLPSAPRPPTSTPSPSDDRVFIQSEPSSLISMLDGLTDVQGQRLLAPYIGKWMRVSGPVSEVKDLQAGSPAGVLVPYAHIYVGPDRTLVSLIFAPEWFDQLSLVRKDETLTAIGKIRAVSPTAVSLYECEMV